MVKNLIHAINSGSTIKEFKIALLDGLQMTRKAWDSVTSTTIANCFHKGGFVLPSENEEIDAEAEMEVEDMHSLE